MKFCELILLFYLKQNFRAAQKRGAKDMVSKFRKAYPKISAQAEELNTKVAVSSLQSDDRAIKWQGFTEAMNLIIASKRG